MKIKKNIIICLLLVICSSMFVSVCFAEEINQNPSNSQPSDKIEPFVIESMTKDTNQSLSDSAGLGYMGTLVGKDKTYIVRLYQADWNAILNSTGIKPEGKTVYLKLKKDNSAGNGNIQVYSIDGVYNSDGSVISY